MKKLQVEDVYKKADLSHLNILGSDDISPLEGEIIKQERAKQAITFGLAVKGFGYNIFVTGGSSTKKRSYLSAALNEAAKKKPVPNDLCFVHNFEEETEPKLLSFPAGKAQDFKAAMADFDAFLATDLKGYFESNDYRKEVELFFQNYDEQYEELIGLYSEKLEVHGFTLANSQNGTLIPSPVDEEGNLLTQEEYNSLDEEAMGYYLDNKKLVDIKMIDYVFEQECLDQKRDKEQLALEKKMATKIIEKHIDQLVKQFGEVEPKTEAYLNAVKQDVLDNIADYKKEEKKAHQPNTVQIISAAPTPKKDKGNPKYAVNIIVDNKELEHAPVVFVEEFDQHTFLGTMEFNVEGQFVSTGFERIIAGDVAKANGGYLVLKVEDLFRNPLMWDKFKSVLKNQEVKLHTRPYRDLVVSNTLKPEPIPVNVKFVLIGDFNWYNALHRSDPEFEELFKIHAIFEEQTKRDTDTEFEYLRFIKKYIDQNKLKPFSLDALEAILEYSSRLADNQQKLVLNFNGIYKLLDEADAWADIEGCEVVTREIVEKALFEKTFRSGFVKEYYDEATLNQVYLLQTDGESVGDINALAVMDYGDFRVGRPSRLTANTYRGTEGVISVDRNAKMSGKLHDKAVDTVKGFLGKSFGQKHPLSIVANVTFEQNYGGIDGDSATSTTLYAILSDLANVPIKQCYAVTGSMNQKGEVQVIGGVNEKVEGFFETCKLQGLTGEQGVLIPEGNVKDLMLTKEVRESIAKGDFHIYAVKHVHQGIEILTGISFEEISKRIEKRLDEIQKQEK